MAQPPHRSPRPNMGLGVAICIALGVVFDNIAIGVGLSLAIGVVVGLVSERRGR